MKRTIACFVFAFISISGMCFTGESVDSKPQQGIDLSDDGYDSSYNDYWMSIDLEQSEYSWDDKGMPDPENMLGEQQYRIKEENVSFDEELIIDPLENKELTTPFETQEYKKTTLLPPAISEDKKERESSPSIPKESREYKKVKQAPPPIPKPSSHVKTQHAPSHEKQKISQKELSHPQTRGEFFVISPIGEVEWPIDYVVTQDLNVVKQGQIDQNSRRKPNDLPPGNYTVFVTSPSQEQVGVANFRVTKERPAIVDIEFEESFTKLKPVAHPPEAVDNRSVVIHKMDPKTATIQWSRKIPPQSTLPASKGIYSIEFPHSEGYRAPQTDGRIQTTVSSQSPHITPIEGRYHKVISDLFIYYRGDHPSVVPHLDQVKVHLTDSKGKNYPFSEKNIKKHQNKQTEGRRVFIPDLPSGQYTLTFLHSEGSEEHIELPPPSPFTVEPEQLVELDYMIKIKRGELIVQASFDEEFEEREDPFLVVEDKQGNVWKRNRGTHLQASQLPPGEYLIKFSTLEGYYPLETVSTRVLSGKNSQPIEGVYQIRPSTLSVKYGTGPEQYRIDEIHFDLIDSEGNAFEIPNATQETLPEESMRVIRIENLKHGRYHVRFALDEKPEEFEALPVDEVHLLPGKSTHLTQKISPRYGSLTAYADLSQLRNIPEKAPWVRLTNDEGEITRQSESGELEIKQLVPGEYTLSFEYIETLHTPEDVKINIKPGENVGPFTGEYREIQALFSLLSNKEAKWKVYRNGEEVQRGEGSVEKLSIPPGTGYELKTQPIHGYIRTQKPSHPFTLGVNEEYKAEINYQPAFGLMVVDSYYPIDDLVTVHLKPKGRGGETPLKYEIRASQNKLYWEKEQLPVGKYSVTFVTPEGVTSPPPMQAVVRKDKTERLEPTFVGTKKILVETNVEEASYKLTNALGKTLVSGMGKEFTFSNLFPGVYSVEFYPISKEYSTPPPRVVEVLHDKDGFVQEEYRKVGRLHLTSNVKNFPITLYPVRGKGNPTEHLCEGKGELLSLSEGNYLVKFLPLQEPFSQRFGSQHPEPVEVVIEPGKVVRIQALYETVQGSLVVTSNLENARFTVRDITNSNDPLTIGHFGGKHSVIPFTYMGKYVVEFETLPHYQTPQPIVVDIQDEKQKSVGGEYLPKEKVSLVPSGAVILGDIFGEGSEDELPARTVELTGFSIGVYQVSNANYADWLTRASKEGTINYVSKGPLKGQVRDQQGHLLFETFLSDEDSQIIAEEFKEYVEFKPIEGKETYPVIEVSWFGARTYCEENGYRLPTEAEWEKAAGMAKTLPGYPLKKYRYGFSGNEISPTLAKYMESYDPTAPKGVNSVPVGYYNGINMLEYNSSIEEQAYQNPNLVLRSYGTQNAQSPYGCYDMSGNVREWVYDWYGKEYYQTLSGNDPQGPGNGVKKITKGGSYANFQFELRVSSRTPLAPETTDAFTGFRVVVDSKQ